MINWSVGKKLRMRRFIDKSGAILAVPMDHGYSLGVVEGLESLNTTVGNVVKGGASCVIMQRGMVRSIDMPNTVGLMVHVSGSSSISTNSNLKVLTGSVIDSIRQGADGVSCHVNIGCEGDDVMLGHLADLAEETDLYNIPLLAMMYNRMENGKDVITVDSLAHIARIAEESGADIVKIHSTPKGKDFDEVIQGINIPVVIAGGAKNDDFSDFLKIVDKCILAGASGVSIGTNVFQAASQELAMKKISKTVRAAVKEVGGIEIIS